MAVDLSISSRITSRLLEKGKIATKVLLHKLHPQKNILSNEKNYYIIMS